MSPVIPISTSEGQRLSEESCSRLFEKLKKYYVPQRHPSACGPASMALLINALKGETRFTEENWFTPSVAFVSSRDTVLSRGMKLHEASAALETQLGYEFRIELVRAFPENLDRFRKDLRVLNEGRYSILLNFMHDIVLGHNDAVPHYSPAAAYHEKKDLVLVMDVDPEYTVPYWVPVPLMFEAMNFRDDVLDLPRGYLVVVHRGTA